ncbi:DUF3280 domain-containing protein [Methylopila musalis]|uniref:DUF3280 domain-containing protein n=1 Tax=Methylopila musalis TaxID=1134781 RepID=A0ABW3ZCE0_9HYPH
MSARRLAAVASALLVSACLTAPLRAEPVAIALLSAEFRNDHAELEPTTEAERRRMDALAANLRDSLAASGRYAVVEVGPETRKRIAEDQKLGNCADCEIAYGRELGVAQVAWIEVQKVSNLILNLNVYIRPVEGGPARVRSVDIRGNTDETWSRAMRYLVRNYVLKPAD